MRAFDLLYATQTWFPIPSSSFRSNSSNYHDLLKRWTPLITAVIKKNLEIVHYLLDSGADLSIGGAYGDQPIHWACRLNHLNILATLLERGASAEARTHGGYTPLHVAAMYGSTEVYLYLLETVCVSPKSVDNFGQFAVDMAPEIMRKQLKMHAQKNGWHKTKLMKLMYEDNFVGFKNELMARLVKPSTAVFADVTNTVHSLPTRDEGMRVDEEEKTLGKEENQNLQVTMIVDYTLLLSSVYLNRLEFVEYMLRHFSGEVIVESEIIGGPKEEEAKCRGEGFLTAFHVACARGHSEMLRLIGSKLKSSSCSMVEKNKDDNFSISFKRKMS